MTAFFNPESGRVWVESEIGTTTHLRSASSKLDAYDAIGETPGYIRTGDWLPAYGCVLQCSVTL